MLQPPVPRGDRPCYRLDIHGSVENAHSACKNKRLQWYYPVVYHIEHAAAWTSHCRDLCWLLAGESLSETCICIHVLENAGMLRHMLDYLVEKQAELDCEHKIIQLKVKAYRSALPLESLVELLAQRFHNMCTEMLLFGEPADPRSDITVQVFVEDVRLWIGCYDACRSTTVLGQFQYKTHVFKS